MAGLYFKQYGQALDEAVKKGVIPKSDIESSLDQIKKGIANSWLWSHTYESILQTQLGTYLNTSWNDINRSNILLDADGTLVVIDFGSCHKPGGSMLNEKYSTFPFSNEETTLVFENDFYEVEKIWEWIEEIP